MSDGVVGVGGEGRRHRMRVSRKIRVFVVVVVENPKGPTFVTGARYCTFLRIQSGERHRIHHHQFRRQKHEQGKENQEQSARHKRVAAH